MSVENFVVLKEQIADATVVEETAGKTIILTNDASCRRLRNNYAALETRETGEGRKTTAVGEQPKLEKLNSSVASDWHQIVKLKEIL